MPLHRGRVVTKTRQLGEPRSLRREDLALLQEKRRDTGVARFRDPHHNLARHLASGLSQKEVGIRTGYSITRIQTLLADPAFQNLVQHYRGLVDEAFAEGVDDYFNLATSNMMKAERQLAEKLDAADEEGETLPTRDLIAISRDAADRFGYGKKQTNLNVNVDFAAQLERAIARSGKAPELKLVESGTGLPAPRQGAPTTPPTHQPQVGAPPLRRRA